MTSRYLQLLQAGGSTASFSAGATLSATATVNHAASATLASSSTLLATAITPIQGSLAVSASAVVSAAATLVKPFINRHLYPLALDLTLELGEPTIVHPPVLFPEALELDLELGEPIFSPKLFPQTLELALLLPGPVIGGGIHLAPVIPRRSVLANVYVRRPWPPFPVFAELTSANSITASWPRMDAGQARIAFSQRDPQLNSDIIRPGNIISIESADLPVWAGPLRTPGHKLSNGEWEINLSDMASILDNRNISQDETVRKSTGLDQLVRSWLTQVNNRAVTGIYLPTVLEIGPSVEEGQQFGGQSLKEALDQACDETNWEWWLELHASRAQLYCELHLGKRQGIDLSNRLHLWSRKDYVDVDYSADYTQIKQSITMYQDFGALLSDRLTVARVGPGGPYDLAARTENASPFALDVLANLPGLRNEKVDFDLMSQSAAQLAKSGSRKQERNLPAVEGMTLTLNHASSWGNYRVGNRLTAHADQGFRDIERKRRIVAMQADWERGQLILSTEAG